MGVNSGARVVFFNCFGCLQLDIIKDVDTLELKYELIFHILFIWLFFFQNCIIFNNFFFRLLLIRLFRSRICTVEKMCPN